jgi:hypothetical protein
MGSSVGVEVLSFHISRVCEGVGGLTLSSERWCVQLGTGSRMACPNNQHLLISVENLVYRQFTTNNSLSTIYHRIDKSQCRTSKHRRSVHRGASSRKWFVCGDKLFAVNLLCAEFSNFSRWIVLRWIVLRWIFLLRIDYGELFVVNCLWWIVCGELFVLSLFCREFFYS